MNSFEFNKVLASVLVSLIVVMLGTFLSEYLVSPGKLEKPAIHIEVVEKASGEEQVKKELAPITPLLSAANVAHGQEIAQKRCAQCHTFDKNGAHRIGPNLWAVVGLKIAHFADYAYSKALQSLSGQKWDAENLNKFLYNPKEFAKGTKMSFPGLASDQDRADLIAYMKTVK